jgi:hypothetical protein
MTEEDRSLAMLVGADELPGRGWSTVRDRTWVTGELDPDSEKSRRAREAGVVTAWRSFEQAATGRSAWVEVVPYATVEDAELSLRQSPPYFVGTDQPDERLVTGGEVEDCRLPDGSDLWVYEKSVEGAAGLRCSRYAAGTIDRILFIASCAGVDGAWARDDLLSLAASLAHRIRSG